MNDPKIDAAIRKVPDFPKPGILFYDISSIFMQPDAFSHVLDRSETVCRKLGADVIAGIEARGFLFASPLAAVLKLPLILIRKKGKLPGKTLEKRFVLEYGEDTIAVHQDDVPSGGRVLLIDDLIATGGTLKAAAELVEDAGARIAGILGVVGLPFLNHKEILKRYTVETLQDYDSE